MENLKKYEVKCLGLDDQAQGEAYIEKGKKVLVPYLLPKEVGIIEYNKINGRAKLVKVLKENKIREIVKCPIYHKCGSCQILHMNYNEQINFKKELVERCLKNEKINYNIKDIITNDKIEAYRNKMQVAYRLKDNKIIYGFYEEESHRIIPLEYCLIQTKKQNEIAKTIATIMKELKIAPYNEDKRSGVIRFALIREAIKTNQILVTIVTNGEMFPGRSEFVKRLKDRCPYINTIIQNYNSRKTSIILGDEERVLFGNGFIEEELCGVKFKISSKTFFQINPYQVEKLYNKVIELANFNKDDIVIDSYCGVGTIGMIVAPYVKEVYGVETNKTSVQYAKMNANNNRISNIHFICEDATEYLKELSKQKAKINGLIMDPPRSGSTPIFLENIKKLKPEKVVYVSCDPHTLARDLKMILDLYSIKNISIVDMFSGTCHVEVLTVLRRI